MSLIRNRKQNKPKKWSDSSKYWNSTKDVFWEKISKYKYWNSKKEFFWVSIKRKEINKKMNFILDNTPFFSIISEKERKTIKDDLLKINNKLSFKEKIIIWENTLDYFKKITKSQNIYEKIIISKIKKALVEEPCLKTKIGFQFCIKIVKNIINKILYEPLNKNKSEIYDFFIKTLTTELEELKINNSNNVEKNTQPQDDFLCFSPFYDKFNSPSHEVNINNFIITNEQIEDFEKVFENLKILNENNYEKIIFDDKEKTNLLIDLENKSSTSGYKSYNL